MIIGGRSELYTVEAAGESLSDRRAHISKNRISDSIYKENVRQADVKLIRIIYGNVKSEPISVRSVLARGQQ